MNPFSTAVSLFYLLRFWTRLSPYRFDSKSVDVSMTSHGSRILTLPVALESIVAGTTKPSGIYVAIDDDESMTLFKSATIRRAQRLGVAVLTGQRIGPHAKYHHYIQTKWRVGDAFVVMDDDIVYRRDILFSLVAAAKSNPNHNICCRSLQIRSSNGSLLPYSDWTLNRRRGAHHRVFATNVGGTYVCAAFAMALYDRGTEFLKKCPRADDVWFKWISINHSIAYYQCLDEFYAPLVIPLTQQTALFKSNIVDGNDAQILSTFSTIEQNALAAVVSDHG